MALFEVGVAFARNGATFLEVGAERAAVKVYKSPPLRTARSNTAQSTAAPAHAYSCDRFL